MKKYFLFLITISFLASLQAQVQSKITQVTVYQQGAKITNTAQIQLLPGNNEVIVQGIPAAIDKNSLQARISGDAILLSATSRTRQLDDSNLPRQTKIIEDSIAITDRQLLWLRSEKTIYQGEEKVITENQKLGTAEQKVSVEEIVALSKFYRERLLDIRGKIFTVDNEIARLEKLKSSLSEKLNSLRYSEKKSIGEIVLTVSSKKMFTSTLIVSYVSYQAGWEPLYDIRAGKANEPVELVYKANISQTTGLNWDKISLTISTGNPLANNNRPMLYPWFVDFTKPVLYDQSYKQKAAPSMMNVYQRSMVSVAEDKELEQEEFVPIGYNVAEYTNIISAAYTIDAPQDFPSDGQQHLVAIQEYKLGSKFIYHAVPKLDAGTFLVAKIADYGNYNLLPGQANLFFDGMYVGQSVLNPQTTVDSMLLSLGRDEKIIVKREQLKDFTARQTIGSSVKETKAYEITVRNNNTFAIELDLLDQLPIAQNKEIEIKLEDSGNAKYEADYGSLSWKLLLKAGETQKVKFVYSVKYPKDKQVAGL